MDVELRHLRAFAAVAGARSFSRAAEQLFITQPALTRTVRQLESLLGADLVDRNTHPISLTPAGQEFLPYATRILSHLNAGVAAVRGHATVRLGFSWLLPDPWAQATVTSFEEETGDAVSLVRCDDPLTDLAQGRIDIALVRGQPPRARDVTTIHLFDETRVAACAAGYEGPGVGAADDPGSAAELNWNDARAWTLVVNTLSGTTGPWSWPDGNGPREIVPTGNFDEWLESVAAGRGIGIVPDVAQRRSIHPGIRFIPVRDAPPSPVFLALRPGVREPLLRRFVRAALNAV